MNSPEFHFRSVVAVLVLCFQMTKGHAQPVVDWAIAGGTPQSDSIRGNLVLSPTGEVWLPGFYDYEGDWGNAQTVLLAYDSRGLPVGTLSSRGELLESVAFDAAGNYWVTGKVNRPQTLGIGVRQQFYLANYSANGTRLWERTAGASTYSASYINIGFRVVADARGNSYVTGSSHGPGKFGDVSFPNTAGGPLLCKYDPNGTLLWAKRAEGNWKVIFGLDTKSGGGSADTAILDPDGNLLIAGRMWNGSANFSGTIISIKGPYEDGAFLAKYSPEGKVLWAKPVPFGDLAVDRQGNVLTSGPLTEGRAEFDGASATVDDPAGYKSFVAKFNAAGSLLWTKAAPIGGMAVDSQGNIYSGTSKLSPAGDLLWARTIPGANLGLGTLNDREEPVFIGRRITGTVQLDEHSVQADPSSVDDSLICKTDTSGKFQWAFGLIGGGVGSWSLRAVSGRAGTIYVSGQLGSCVWSEAAGGNVCSDTATFGSIPISLQMGGTSDIFLARINDPVPVTVELKAARSASNLALSWPVSATGYVLESTDALPAANWSAVPESPSIAGDQYVVTVAPASDSRFFRLRKP